MTKTQPDNQATFRRPEWLSEEAWPFEIRSVAVDRTQVAYTDEGTGPILLLVHDGMCSYLWVHLIERLRHRFRIVTLDFPGSGLSAETDVSPGLETDSRLLEDFVARLGLTDLTLVVHDLGGGVGLGWATRRPDLVQGLVLVNTFAWPPISRGLRGMLRLMGSRPMAAINSRTNLMARATSSRFGVGRHFDREKKRAFVGMFRRRDSRRRFHALMASALSDVDYLTQVEEDLHRLAAKPVLTIFGKRNDPFQFQATWREHYPDMEQMQIPGGYHFPMCDAPDDVAERIADWHHRRVT